MMSYANIRKGGLNAVNLRDDDELIAVMVTDGSKDIFCATHNGYGIRFKESDARPVGRTSIGVRAIKLRDDDYVVSAGIIDESMQLLNVTENGYGKRTQISEFNVQNRGGMGVKIHQVTSKTGLIAGTLMLADDEEVMLITSEGIIIRLRGNDISTVGRVSQGVKLINLNDGVQVVSAAKITSDQIAEEEENLDDSDEDSENDDSEDNNYNNNDSNNDDE
jgi:DNA gyrase subunit A